MSKDRLVAGAMFAVGALVLAGVYVSTLPDKNVLENASSASSVVDEPGPYLDIEVAGEANGTITIDLMAQHAPAHVERVTSLAIAGDYNDVVFHRVIEGFMAQTGDVEYGKFGEDLRLAGRGGSVLPDLPSEFSDTPYVAGVVGMARSQDPNSANSQFFIMFGPAPSLNGSYTVLGRVVEGQDVVDAIKRGTGANGAVIGEPDRMVSVTVRD